MTTPPGVILPIWFALNSVNQMLPSEPSAAPSGSAPYFVGSGYSVMV